jgi:tetratricopeptide (TPR) repeat protein
VTLGAMNNMAMVWFRRGDYAAAADVQDQLVHAWREAGLETAVATTAIHNLGVMRMRAGDVEGAEEPLLEALATRRKQLGEGHIDVAVSLRWLSELRRRQGRFADAERVARAALTTFEEQLPPGHTRVTEAQICLGAALVERRRGADAIPLLRGALEARANAPPPNALPIAEAQLWLGIALRQTGRNAEAALLIRSSWTSYQSENRVHEDEAQRARRELDIESS